MSVVVKQLFTKQMSHFAYYLESQGEAIVIDPLRFINQYVELAKSRDAKIVAVLVTHLPEDYVSGHVDLAAAVGVKPGIGSAVAGCPPLSCFDPLHNEHVVYFGNASLKVLHTPGHSAECVSFVLSAADRAEFALFSGDTLLLNDVGRTDMRVDGASTEEASGALYDSLQKLGQLGDAVQVYPSHGKSSSSCALNTHPADAPTTIGEQRTQNAAFRLALSSTRPEFCAFLQQHQSVAPPLYFTRMHELNRAATLPTCDEVEARLKRTISLSQLDALIGDIKMCGSSASVDKPLLVDMRHSTDFTACHIPGSVFFGVEEGSYPPYIATCFPHTNQPVVVIAPDEQRLPEIARGLAFVGFDNLLGHLERGFWAWKNAGRPVTSIDNVTVGEVADLVVKDPDTYVVDCRKPHEYRAKHLKTAQLVPMESRTIAKVDLTKPAIYCYCRGGYRSIVFLTIASAFYGYKGRCVNVLAGYEGMNASEKCAPLMVSESTPKL